jgi:general secretion pathway protein I
MENEIDFPYDSSGTGAGDARFIMSTQKETSVDTRNRVHSASSGTGLQTGGFTLLEVLIALAVMAIATTLVMQLFSTDLRAIAASGGVTSAAVRGDSRIREILAEPSLEENAWSEEAEDGYRMDIAISEVMKPRTDNLPGKLMEVDLTIRWTEGRKEKSLRLKTMKMIDKAAPAGKRSLAPA